jgi:hypothetical protein
MRDRRFAILPLFLAVSAATAVAAQLPTPRPLGPVVATASVPFRTVAQVVPMHDGSILVNDAGARIVFRLDAQLANPRTIIDSVAGNANSYGPVAGMLSAFAADSAVFYEIRSASLMVLDAQGKIERVMDAPFGASSGVSGRPSSLGYAPAFGFVYVATSNPCSARGGAPAAGRARHHHRV